MPRSKCHVFSADYLDCVGAWNLNRIALGICHQKGLGRPPGVMRNTLQYAYSIAVLSGVLVTAYLMMNKEGNARIPLPEFQSQSYRTEALSVDPGVTQLFEMEDALAHLPSDPLPVPAEPPYPQQRRVPSNTKSRMPLK